MSKKDVKRDDEIADMLMQRGMMNVEELEDIWEDEDDER